jgi:hypothetical protein
MMYVKHILCEFHLVVQQFDNDVLNKEDREGIVYQVKNWILSFTNYCESEDKYKLSYKLIIEFMNIPDIFESMGLAFPYILDNYLLSTWIKNKDKILYYKRMFLHNLKIVPPFVRRLIILLSNKVTTVSALQLTAVQVMTDKSNHRMLVKEGKSAKSMYSTKL